MSTHPTMPAAQPTTQPLRTFRVYLTHTHAHATGWFQAKGESEHLHVAVTAAIARYFLLSERTVPGSADALALSGMLERAWNMVAGQANVPVVTIFNGDRTLGVEIFR